MALYEFCIIIIIIAVIIIVTIIITTITSSTYSKSPVYPRPPRFRDVVRRGLRVLSPPKLLLPLP